MRRVLAYGSEAGTRMFSIASVSQKSNIGYIVFVVVVVFVTLHMIQWTVKCGPLASGKFRDYCAEVQQARTKPVIVNEATYARAKASKTSPYVDLREDAEVLQEFLPPGYGRSKINANVREGPGMNYDTFASLEKDSIVEIIEEQNGWIKIKLPDKDSAETFGWVWKDLLAQ